ncbi:ATPase domain-containing protein, partial [Mobilicoccus sp.]|uniref:ATPase domain-containing protein n=1 Tax=Mobilicoccus sp. TaxID=2034349 RepID=UPI00289C0195
MTTSTSSRRKNGRPAQTGHRCTECGWTSVKWVGRCGGCGAWGTVVELDGAPAGRTRPAGSVARPAQPIGTVDATAAEAASTGVGEFDRVLGGGLVKGAVALVTGEPGSGKSTLLLDVAARTARLGR